MRLLRAQDVEDVAGVALRAVGDEDLVVGDVEPVRAVIVFRDGVAEEFVPLLGPVAVKAVARAHLVHGPVQRLARGGGQRLGHVADAAADEALGGLRIRGAKGIHPAGDFGKEIAGAELEVVVVEQSHRRKRRGATFLSPPGSLARTAMRPSRK